MSANFIITAKKITALQYEILAKNVSNILEKCLTNDKTITALGMGDVEFYREATQKGVTQDIAKDLTSGESIAIIDLTTFTIIFSAADDEKKFLLDKSLIQFMATQQNGQTEYDQVFAENKTKSVMTVFGVYPQWNWLVVSSVDKNQLFKYSRDAMLFSFVAAGVFLLFIFFAIYKLSHSVSKTIVALQKGAHQIAINNFSNNIVIKGNDEFSSLANSFNVMSAEIKQTQHQLKLAITEEKKTNSDLQVSEQRQKLALFGADLGLWDYNLVSGVTVFDERWCAMIGRTTDEVVQHVDNWISLLHPGDAPSVIAALDAQLKIDTTDYDIKFRLKHRDGHWVWIRARGKVVERDSKGSPVRMTGTHMDISEQIHAEEKQKQFTDRLALATRAGRIGIWEYDTSNKKFMWDDAMYVLYGITANQFSGSYDAWQQRIHPDDKTRSHTEIKAALSGEKEFDTEFRTLWPNGEIHYIRAIAIVQRDPDGNPLRIIGTNWDITEEKNNMLERVELIKQLNQSQKIEAVGQLAGGIAHDFNNMLAVITGHAELAIKRLDLSHPVHKHLNIIFNAATHSAELTQQLLTFARKQTIEPKVIKLDDSVKTMLAMLQRLIGENIQLKWQSDPNLWSIKVDVSQINQIIANLCVNARDAISTIGHITISTTNMTLTESFNNTHPNAIPAGEYVLLCVNDDGMGMDTRIMEHIFEPFYTTKDIGSGTGLGLSTVFGAVQQNMGFIEVLSELNHGTTFNIYFPRTCNTIKSEPKTMHTNIVAGSETILVVEDDEMLLELAIDILEQNGYTVLPASSASHAQALAEQYTGKIHLLLTDVIMPEMNGKELAIKLLANHSDLKVLFMSGYTADIISTHGVIEKDINFLNKPFTVEKLITKVREVLNNK